MFCLKEHYKFGSREFSHYLAPHVDRVNRKWPSPNHLICPSASGQFQTATDVKSKTCFIYTLRDNRSDNRDGIII
jgi:hypothetical protein